MHGQLDPKSWETQSAAFIKHVWFTDCRSVYDTLQKPVAKTVDKRLGIELAALRQFLWRKVDCHLPPRRCLEEKPVVEERTDILKWIDTTVMLVDCFTKLMRDDYLKKCLEENYWDYVQTDAAKELNRRRKVSRANSKRSRGRPEDLPLEP